MQGSLFRLMEKEDGYHTDTVFILCHIVVTHDCNVSNKSAIRRGSVLSIGSLTLCDSMCLNRSIKYDPSTN